MAFTIVSLNVHGLMRRNHWERTKGTLQALKADIICLQECRIALAREYTHLRKRWDGGPSWWAELDDNKAAGLGILVDAGWVNVKSVQTFIQG